MAEIQQFLSTVKDDLGVSEDTVRSATGGLFGFLEDKLPGGDFQALLGEIPGAADLMRSGGSGGLLGTVSRLAGGAGNKLGAAAGIVGSLTQGGLEVRHVGGFVANFLDFTKANLSGDLLQRLLLKVPELKHVVE